MNDKKSRKFHTKSWRQVSHELSRKLSEDRTEP